MELTDKCKEAFKSWLIKTYDRELNPMRLKGGEFHIDVFNQLPEQMQYGCYVDFFDSVEMFTEMVKHTHYGYCCSLVDKIGGRMCEELVSFKTRQEARTKSIEKANEIFNNKK